LEGKSKGLRNLRPRRSVVIFSGLQARAITEGRRKGTGRRLANIGCQERKRYSVHGELGVPGFFTIPELH